MSSDPRITRITRVATIKRQTRAAHMAVSCRSRHACMARA